MADRLCPIPARISASPTTLVAATMRRPSLTRLPDLAASRQARPQMSLPEAGHLRLRFLPQRLLQPGVPRATLQGALEEAERKAWLLRDLAGVLAHELARLAGQPVDKQPGPFVHGGVGAGETAGQRSERPREIVRTAGAEIHRIGLDRKAGLPEQAHRAGHVMRRSNQ